ncbi:hypothetical protein [Bremerella cremea]|uniref:hypothetical protein n=1 Tax=Bremerella cremea TaxID=1031537 RepID=UPI0011C03C58|nr:hypothetical protein [Bremerella cremea]
MVSLFRPLYVLVLCGMLAAGHAPAWFHLATCGDTCQTHHHDRGSHTHAHPNHDTTCGAHHCCHHDSSSATRTEQPGEEPSDQAPHHHPDGCVVCQSLALVAAITWVKPVRVSLQPACEQIALQTQLPVCDSLVALSQARAPPRAA